MSTTAAASRASPSVFATLLRRSKFASFDPTINQAYTAPPAHRSRGQWGLKHHTSLAQNAPKPKYMSVPAADTYYNQMVWQSAENNVRYVKQQEELGYVLEMQTDGDSALKERVVAAGVPTGPSPTDSDFELVSHPAKNDLNFSPPTDVWQDRQQQGPNMLKMNAKQFKRYVEELRQQRQKFKEYVIRKKKLQDTRHSRSLSHLSSTNADDGDGKDDDFTFLEFGTRNTARQMPEEFLKNFPPGDSHTRLTSYPHPTGGLLYQHTPPLQSYLMHGLVPGHMIGRDGRQNRNDTDYLIDIGTHVGRVPINQSEGASATEALVNDPNRGAPRYRVWRGSMAKTPVVVDRREGVEATRMRLMLRTAADGEADRGNPHRPGTRQWATNDALARKKAQSAKESVNRLNLHRTAPRVSVARSATGSLASWTRKAAEPSGTEIMNVLSNLLASSRRPSQSGTEKDVHRSPTEGKDGEGKS